MFEREFGPSPSGNSDSAVAALVRNVIGSRNVVFPPGSRRTATRNEGSGAPSQRKAQKRRAS
jgi:hypothetical protein